MRPRVTIVAAMSSNMVIGVDGKLPWRLPADLRRVAELTRGRPVILGRLTLGSIDPAVLARGGGGLPGRPTVVLSRRPGYAPPGVTVARSLDEAVEAAAARLGPDGEVVVLGGADVYAEAIVRADRMHLTLVRTTVPRGPGARTFPAGWLQGVDGWRVVPGTMARHPADSEHAHAFDVFTVARACQ